MSVQTDPIFDIAQRKSDFAQDFLEGAGETEVDRQSLIAALREFARVNELKVDWDGIDNAPNEALVNALAMMSPYGAAEKQALLEAREVHKSYWMGQKEIHVLRGASFSLRAAWRCVTWASSCAITLASSLSLVAASTVPALTPI